MALVSLKASSKGIMLLIVLAVVIFFGCVLVYLGAAGKMKGVEAELAQKEKQVKDSTKIAQTLEESRLKFLDTRSQIRCLESSVSTHAYVPTLLKQLEGLGKSVNLRVLGVRPQPVKAEPVTRKLSSGAQASEGNVEAASQSKANTVGKQAAKPATKPYDELKIDLELRGNYMNALDFLYKLTSFPKIISVNSVDMRTCARTDPGVSPMLDIKINVTAFVFKDNDSGSTVEVPQAKSARRLAGEGRHVDES